MNELSASSGPIRILIVDDHPLFREGVIALLSDQPGLVMVGEASDGREAIEMYRKLRPDITLMDMQLPVMSGIDATIAIRSEFPDSRIIVVTTHAGDALAQRALKAGARAYVLKNLARKDLLETIRVVSAGERWIQHTVAVDIATRAAEDALTARELEVLTLISGGLSNKSVGAKLSINEDTVKGHVKRILAKLGARDRTHAVVMAIRRGILHP